MDREKRDKKLKQMAADLFGMRFSDDGGIDNYFLNKFMCEYTAILMPKLDNWFETVWNGQKSKKDSYGDIDVSITKFDGKAIDRDGTIKENDKRIRAMFIENHCSCAEHTRFVLIQEKSSWAEENPEEAAKMDEKTLEHFKRFDTLKYHIRIVWENGDYRKGNNHVNRPTLKWYKDRKFCLEYVDKFHMGPLGGTYADLRDPGYVLTAEIKFGEWRVEDEVMSRFHMFQHVVRNLTCAIYDLNENEK